MRGIMMTTVGLAAALALAGCDAPEGGHADAAADIEMVMPSTSVVAEAASPAAPIRIAPPVNPAQLPGAAPAMAPVQPSQIAYVYSYGLELPASRAPELMRRHEQACVAAGPAVCQVIGAETSRYGNDAVSARLELRAAPAFLNRFRAGLEGDAEKAGGWLAMASTSSEDLTRQLSDTEARLRALSTLRDRLLQLLATRSAPLDQLLATERELARVQGELDATTSALAVMRTRVAMSRVTVDYQAQQQFASDGVFSPVANALKGSLRAFMGTLGVLIYAIAMLAPLGLLLSPLLWLGLRWRKRRTDRKAAAEG